MFNRSTKRLAAGVALALLAAGGLVASGVEARPLIPAEKRYEPFEGKVPRCDDPAVLDALKARFAGKEATYWREDIHILGFDHVRQTGLRSWGMDHVPRRYCSAVAVTDEAAPKAALPRGAWRLPKRTVNFNIIENGGFAGYGWGVEFCMQHHDHNAAFAPGCKAAGP